MPLTVDSYDLNRLSEILRETPSEVRSGGILWMGREFTFKYDKSLGEHILTWKEPRK